jgi:hypothetical protein
MRDLITLFTLNTVAAAHAEPKPSPRTTHIS